MKNEVTLSQDGTVAHILLTQGQTTTVDADDLPSVMQHHWYAMRKKGGDRYYAVTNVRGDNGKMGMLQLGRLLTNAEPDERVTYINGDSMDNKKDNLKCTPKVTGFSVKDLSISRKKNRASIANSEPMPENRMVNGSLCFSRLPLNNDHNMYDDYTLSEDGSYAIVKITRGQTILVDVDDLPLLAKYRWHVMLDIRTKSVSTDNHHRKGRKQRKNNTSGFRGVSLYKRLGTWQAQITVDGKTMSLGQYSSPEMAYAAYCTAAAWYHGAFAYFDPEPPEGSVEEWMIA